MQSEMTKQKLHLVLSMLEAKSEKKGLKLEEAKLKVLLNDPLPELSHELKLLNHGKIDELLVSVVDRFFILPTLRKIFIK